MEKLTISLIFGVFVCVLDVCIGEGFYYYAYPSPQAALSYPPMPYNAYAPYAFLPIDCDQDKDTGAVKTESSASSSSESNSDSNESSEGGKSEKSSESSSSSSSEEEGKTVEQEGESKEGSKESDSSSESKSSSESNESKEGDRKAEGKGKKAPVPSTKYVFPPRALPQYVFRPQPFLPYRTAYSVVQPPISYPVKSPYYTAGYASPFNRFPIIPTARYVSGTLPKYMTPITYSMPAAGSLSYWGPNSYYFKK